MENSDLIKRAADLARRCQQRDCITATGFLSPTEQYELEHDVSLRDYSFVFRGGHPDHERAMSFFLPSYMDEAELDVEEYIVAIKISSPYGTPTHRDYMGALLAMGVSRDRIGDIIVSESSAYVLCQKSIAAYLLGVEKIGRYAVKTESIELHEIPQRTLQLEERSFTVMSPRLDAVLSGMFHISRSEAVRQISSGNVSLNYTQCLKPDKELKESDIISIRGQGKGRVKELGGNSRKGRLFIVCQLYK